MNKITLLLIIFSLPLFAGGEEGSGNSPASGEHGTGNSPESTTSGDTNYQLVCTTNTDSAQQDNNQDCILVPVTTED